MFLSFSYLYIFSHVIMALSQVTLIKQSVCSELCKDFYVVYQL